MAGKFVKRERKHKRLAKAGKMDGGKPLKVKQDRPEDEEDPASTTSEPNAAVPTEIVPAVTPRQALLTSASAAGITVTADDVAGMSAAKRKRFEKYVASKGRKHEAGQLIRALEQEQQQMRAAEGEAQPESLFRNMRQIGNTDTKRDRLRRELGQFRAGISSGEGLFEQRQLDEGNDSDSATSSGDGSSDDGEDHNSLLRSGVVLPSEPASLVPAAGSGLKRPLEMGEDGLPIIRKRACKRTSSAASASLLEGIISSKDEAEAVVRPTKITKSGGKSGEEMSDVSSWYGFSDGEPGETEPASDPSIRSALRSPGLRPGPRKRVRWSLGGSGDENDDDEEEQGGGSIVNGSQPSVDSEGSDSSDDSDSEAGSDSDELNGDALAYKTERRKRASDFVAWGTQQRNAAVGFTPSAKDDADAELPMPGSGPTEAEKANFTPRPAEVDTEALPAGFDLTTKQGASRVAHAVSIVRPEAIQKVRLQLPVVAEEQKIMEAIHNNDVTIICGATGSGKTTQVPQFLLESGFGAKDGPTPGIVAVTQPRRVAAVSVAARVRAELGTIGPSRVGHQVRFDRNVGPSTAIKFVTEGILLRELATDFCLSTYSAVVIDEAHERGVNTDVLVGMLSRVVRLRRDGAGPGYPLKLIIMSATLRTADFADNRQLFSIPPPIVKAEGRQHDVAVHWARRTKADYVAELGSKLRRAHGKLPPGGILVFLTGQDEIRRLTTLLQELPGGSEESGSEPEVRVAISPADAMPEDEDVALGGNRSDTISRRKEDGADESDDYENENDDDLSLVGLDESDDSGEADEFDVPDDEPVEADPNSDPDPDRPRTTGTIFGRDRPKQVHVLPLYSQLPTARQLRVFEPPPEGSRLIVLATNVAETSITIPGIRYVFDCGRAKRRHYDRVTGVERFDIGWVSRAAAEQRAGRAGRTGPGHVYRMYSSAIYEADFAAFDPPAIVDAPLEGVVLSLRALGLRSIATFPFPTPPDQTALRRADRLLSFLGALDLSGGVTATGQRLAAFPLSPRLGRILLLGHSHGIAPFAIAMVAALAVGELFIPAGEVMPRTETEVGANSDADSDVDDKSIIQTPQFDRNSESARAYRRAHAILSQWDSTSDAIKMLTAVCGYGYSAESEARDGWALEHFVRPKAASEATQLREQLTTVLSSVMAPAPPLRFVSRLETASKKQTAMLRQMVAAGFLDQVAVRADIAASSLVPRNTRKPRRAGEVAYLPLFAARDEAEIAELRRHKVGSTSTPDPAVAATSALFTHCIFIHPSSVLAHRSFSSAVDLPEYIIYHRLERKTRRPTATGGTPSPVDRIVMHPLTSIGGTQLASLANGTGLLRFGKPIGRVVDLPPSQAGEARREAWVVPQLVGSAEDGTGDGGVAREWPLPARRVIERRDRHSGWVVDELLEGVGSGRKT